MGGGYCQKEKYALKLYSLRRYKATATKTIRRENSADGKHDKLTVSGFTQVTFHFFNACKKIVYWIFSF